LKRLLVLIAACAPALPPLAPRPPLARDTDLDPVAAPMPKTYDSPFLWDEVDNLIFARLSRGLSVHHSGEAINANSVDEVADSAWFTNDPHPDCEPISDDAEDGSWVIDHGKDNGSSRGFRVKIPGKGDYMLKIDDPDAPEIASAASAIGAAIYAAVGFNTSCDQVITIRRAQLKLKPGLKVKTNSGKELPFDEKELDAVLKSAAKVGDRYRVVASKWLPGAPLGPFRYEGVREDDPADVIDHERRRELRGARLLAAWLEHWDAREQNSMDVWMAVDEKQKKSSPGHVVHYLLDTSDAVGARNMPYEVAIRLGHAYVVDAAATLTAIATLGVLHEPGDHEQLVKGREKFSYYRADDFDPEGWVGAYPNPAFLAMTERDGAWMARKLARFSEDDIRKFAALGKFKDPGDTAYLADVMIARQKKLLARYFAHLSPLGDLRSDGERVCATDFAALRGLAQGPTEVCAKPTGATVVLRGSMGGPLHVQVYDGAHIAGAWR